MPAGVSWPQMWGLATCAGILAGSLVAGVAGFVILRITAQHQAA